MVMTEAVPGAEQFHFDAFLNLPTFQFGSGERINDLGGPVDGFEYWML